MPTNIERAINDLITSNKDITLANALPAYLRVAGYKEMSVDALIAFENALDKYPTRPDESRAVFAKGVFGLSAEYWSTQRAVLSDADFVYFDTCQGAWRSFNLGAEIKAHKRERPEPEEEQEKVPKRRLKSKKKKGRRVRAKRDVVTADFDPYAPSTSAVML